MLAILAALPALWIFQEPVPKAEISREAVVFFEPQVELAVFLLALGKSWEVSIEFDASTQEGRLASVEPGRSYSKEDLGRLAERELAVLGLTTVHSPGAPELRVVQLADAPGLARLEDPSLSLTRSAFAKVLLPLEYRPAAETVDSAKLLLSKHGTVSALKEGNSLLLADLTSHLEQVLLALRLLDVPAAVPEIEEFPLLHTSPAALSVVLDRLNASRRQVTGEFLKGSAFALSGSKNLVVVAPTEEMLWWKDLVRRFDRPSPVRTVQYHPQRFGLRATARLIEEVVGEAPSGDSATPWRVVVDELTGSLVVTASEDRHIEVEDLLFRLDSESAGPARSMRAFPIHHRRVSEVLTLLQGLLDAGVLAQMEPVDPSAAPPAPGATGGRPPGTSKERPPITIASDEATNRLIAFGEAPVLDQLERLLVTLDVRHAQVLIEAMVVTLSDSEALDLGVELQHQGVSGDTLYQLGSLFGLGSVDPGSIELPAASGTGFSGALLEPGDYSAVVRALETISHGRTLTRPKILVNNNQSATLNSVLQTPFASTNASTTVATTSFGGTLDAGTTIQVKPQVADGDQIVLEYTVSLSTFAGEAPTPELPPPRQEDKLQSVVTIPDGHTVVVGGLEIESETEGRSQIPILGDLPLIGVLFQDSSKKTQRNRFYVFIRSTAMRASAFEDLRWASAPELAIAGLNDGWPVLEPRIMR